MKKDGFESFIRRTAISNNDKEISRFTRRHSLIYQQQPFPPSTKVTMVGKASRRGDGGEGDF